MERSAVKGGGQACMRFASFASCASNKGLVVVLTECLHTRCSNTSTAAAAIAACGVICITTLRCYSRATCINALRFNTCQPIDRIWLPPYSLRVDCLFRHPLWPQATWIGEYPCVVLRARRREVMNATLIPSSRPLPLSNLWLPLGWQ